MNNFLNKILNNEIVRNSSVLLSGNFIGQAIAFAVYPILTRLYSESDFGVFATYASICTFLAVVGTLRYEESLVIAETDDEKNKLFSFSFRFLISFSFLLFVVLLFFGKSVLSFFKFEKISDFWVYIPFHVLFTGSIALLTNLAIREKKFKKIASAGVIQNTTNAGSRVAFGSFGLTKMGLIISNVIALFAAASFLFPIRKSASSKSSLPDETHTALKYRDFPLYNGARSAISQVSSNLPFLYLIGFFDTGILGVFSLAFIVLTTPVNLIINSLFTTFFEKLSSLHKQNEVIIPIIKKYWKSLCYYILPLFVIGFFIAKPVFAFVFGSQWTVAGEYFSYMLPWGFMMLIINPFYSVFIVFRKQKLFLSIDFLYLLIRFIALFVGVKMDDFKLCIILFTLAGIVFSLIYLIIINHILQKYEKNRI
ncbi:MAG: oligosaccharide flippase family protein [Dysgonamonadaceae bacterium]|nr:oligosaccharide flippase family protein [Dysgonamonadaceae bacterium]